ncbi:MAG: hypothetical protein ACN4GT_03825 [Gammaproteobacteria bacterium]
MSSVALRIMLTLALALLTTPANAQRLSRDPFEVPEEFLTTAARPNALTGSTTGGKAEIRGILFAGGRSLVNLSGEIIGPGEEARGYKLLEVAEDHAVFLRDDEIVTLSLDPDKDSEQDNDRNER